MKLFLEGHVSWHREDALAARGIPSGDFHEWFEIDNVPTETAVEVLGMPIVKAPLKTVESKLFFNGHAGKLGRQRKLPDDAEQLHGADDVLSRTRNLRAARKAERARRRRR